MKIFYDDDETTVAEGEENDDEEEDISSKEATLVPKDIPSAPKWLIRPNEISQR